MTRPFVRLLATVLLAMAADLVTFVLVVPLVGAAQEQNPIMRRAFTGFGVGMVVALKAACTLAVLLLVARVRRPRLRYVAAGLGLAFGLLGVFGNLSAWASRPVAGPPPVTGATLAFYEPSPPPVLTAASPPASAPVRPAAGQALRGIATWYATGPDCLCAAAGPALRAAIGAGWRGAIVEVRVPMANERLMGVQLVDACWCIDRHGAPTLLDLSDEAVAALGLDLRRGVYEVAVKP